ncbi:MAG: hypothetical protein KAY05_05470 [Aeromonadaceae bacterium]|nr:hypothetical protein [Aeromonadaceae bacterium]
MVIGSSSSLNTTSYGMVSMPGRPTPTPEQKNTVQNAVLDAQDARQVEQQQKQTATRTVVVGAVETNNQQQAIEAYVNSSDAAEDVDLTRESNGNVLDLYQQQQRAQQLQELYSKNPLQKMVDTMTGNSTTPGSYIATTA